MRVALLRDCFPYAEQYRAAVCLDWWAPGAPRVRYATLVSRILISCASTEEWAPQVTARARFGEAQFQEYWLVAKSAVVTAGQKTLVTTYSVPRRRSGV